MSEAGLKTPAAVQLDGSRSSPLIQVLYRATRETKKQAILDKLDEAKKLLDDGAALKATDERGRTALHWVIFGSSYNTDSKIIVEYEQIADQLIAKGVDPIRRPPTTILLRTICSTRRILKCRCS